MKHLFVIGLLCLWPVLHGHQNTSVWGFYGHRLINRMAVFTLPSGMIGLYKFNIDYISDHAVDPDKRRYATRHEAVRHYIDLDQWGEPPFEKVPRRWTEMLAAYLKIECVSEPGDTVVLHNPFIENGNPDEMPRMLRAFTARHVVRQYYEESWTFEPDTIKAYFPETDCSDCVAVIGSEGFSEHGILPYHLNAMQYRLADAFARKDLKAVLQLSAEFGHYIADAHVPLHTTKNYNGQLTDQVGIHAFWESRIPELFAEKEWDFLVGQARYIDDPVQHYWDIVLKSHAFVEDVLQIEKDLSKEFAEDAQYCFEERLNVVVRTQCEAYARTYQDRMQGMVEARMQDAIYSVGCAWFTAWVDGGQPVFEDFMLEMSESERSAFEDLERAYIKGEAFGRGHD